MIIMYTDTQNTIRNTLWNFIGALYTNSAYDDNKKKKENVTALITEELCKFCKEDENKIDLNAAKPIFKSSIWLLKAKKTELLKDIDEHNIVTTDAISSSIKELDMLIEALETYIARIK